ncbi:DM13 domain-containing protein [Streptomyces sp. A3M-1-3]|uniref:DM13 domain-containing protein n=1 Tax=Streptomyces sp. A3M-1-3 TaxID=2962044 RepID=UPI0020B8C2E9|nr:DM13 domain-containing protein [Streptomyces sp. A3M-1-3]MCP3818344.1 DM13 domain-containing protein [Streptomyces sp. A3M-1-3]
MKLFTRRTLVPAFLVLAVLAAFALYLFQPWKLFTNTTVDESLPTAAPSASAPEQPGAAAESPEAAPESPAAGPQELARGSFVSHEHSTSGTAKTVRLADGGQVLRFEDLKTDEGPDVRVYLSKRSAQDVEAGLGDGAVQLAGLKGNLGNQNYVVPAGTDLSGFKSAVIWCKRFSVSFGAADLVAVRGV